MNHVPFLVNCQLIFITVLFSTLIFDFWLGFGLIFGFDMGFYKRYVIFGYLQILKIFSFQVITKMGNSLRMQKMDTANF